MLPKFTGTVKKGNLVIAEWQQPQRQAYLEGLEGKEVEEIIQKPAKSKTLQQLRYVHGVVFKIASEASGYTVQEVKGLLKGEFLTQYITSPTGKEIAWVPSLADLKVGEMAEFIDSCIILIAKHWHAIVPPPEQVTF